MDSHPFGHVNTFMPHGHCFLWQPELLWFHVISDALIVIAYYSIPIALLYFVSHRKDLIFNWMFVLFGIFIFACGTTHLMSILNMWKAYYWLEGGIKLMTAIVSITTAILLWSLMPKMLRIPSPAQLETANLALASEIKERMLAEQALRELNTELEQRVEERTRTIYEAKEKLQQEIEVRQSADAALSRQAEALSRSNAELEQFAYVISHDLREPLRAVHSYTELLEKRYLGQLDERADKYIRYIVSGAKRMGELISDLLNYSRLGKKEAPMQLTNMDELLKDVLENLRATIGSKQAQIQIEPLPVIPANPTRMKQLFQNLLSNAIKFNTQESPHIIITAEKTDLGWQFQVSDNGIGIDPQHHERIFEIFQRLHNQDTYPGTGVGLALCKKIVEQWGGKIGVTSEPGKGSVFYFTIPEKAPAATPSNSNPQNE